MKKNRCKKWMKILIAMGLLVIMCVYTLVTDAPNQIEVRGDVATIRVPGEYKDKAKITYNSEYVEQHAKNSILTLTFKKQGYYMCSVGKNDYVFKVLNGNDDNYTVDLLEEEHRAIMANAFGKCLIRAIVMWFVFIGAYELIRFMMKITITEKGNTENNKGVD